MPTIDDLVSDIITSVEQNSTAAPVEDNTTGQDAFVNDVLRDLLDNHETSHEVESNATPMSENGFEDYGETYEDSDEDVDDRLDRDDFIECPDCGAYAYHRESTYSYYCPNCGWEGDDDEPTDEQEEVATPEDTQAVLNDIEDSTHQDSLESAVSEVVEASVPQNSESLLVDDTTARFRGAPWYDIVKEQLIILAGLGGIGSYVNFFLARMKPRAIYLYDDDIVESVNMSGQFYGSNAFGKTKVKASMDIANIFADYYDEFGDRRRFTAESEASDIMICGFDNMEARKIFFNKWLQHVNIKPESERFKCLYIDGRLAAESMQVFCITGNDTASIEKYQSTWLFEDSEADTTICSYKQTTYCAAMIGALITNLFVNFCTNLGEPLFDRELPFFTSYDAELMQFKTEY